MSKEHVVCERCGHDRYEHHLANYCDPPFVGKSVLVCPDTVFQCEGYDTDGVKKP